jgi:hypothetical protein
MLEATALDAKILDFHGTNHWPIQLWLDILTTPRCKPFKMVQFWLNHPDFQQNAHIWWEEVTVSTGTNMYRLQQKINNFKQKLKNWNKKKFGNIFEAQNHLMEQMSNVQGQIWDRGLTEPLKQ